MIVRFFTLIVALFFAAVAVCYAIGIDPVRYLPPEQEQWVIQFGRSITDGYRSIGTSDEMYFAGIFFLALGLLYLLFRQIE